MLKLAEEGVGALSKERPFCLLVVNSLSSELLETLLEYTERPPATPTCEEGRGRVVIVSQVCACCPKLG